MTMFMNLHTLPAGKHMYTAYVTYDQPGEVRDVDEIDFVANATSNAQIAVAWAKCSDTFVACYLGARVIGVIDQSTGYVVFMHPDVGKVRS